MAKSSNNVVMQGASGMIGKMLVFRVLAGNKTVIARRPKPRSKPASEKQQEVMGRFTEASYYAKNAIKDEVLKAAYQAKAKVGQTAFNMAFSDYLKGPEVKKVFADAYQGAVGNEIIFRVIDNFEVKGVQVAIMDTNDSLLEQGEATLMANGIDWLYTTTVANANVLGSKLQVTATDLPGNVTHFDAEIGS